MTPRPRSGFTLLELMIALAILVLLSSLGIGPLQELVPRFRARRAAKDFASQVMQARQLAMLNGLETRILLDEYDSNPFSKSSANAGRYFIQMGNRAMGSTQWDTLPVDEGASDDTQGEGTVDISKDGDDYLKGVSIEDWGTLVGPGSSGNADSIVFNPRGWVVNPAADFNNTSDSDSNGGIEVNFVNKFSKSSSNPDRFTVRIYRGGMVRVDADLGKGFEENNGGTQSTSTYP